MRVGIKSAPINLLLVISSLLVIAILFEIALRCIYSAGERARMSTIFLPPNIWRPLNDPVSHWLYTFPDAPKEGDLVQVNQFQYRIEPEHQLPRVLFLGDSGTVGYGVSFNLSFPFRAQNALRNNPSPKKIEVINAGVYGMTPFDELIVYDEKLKILKPDAVVLGLFMANDIGFSLLASQRERLAREQPLLSGTVRFLQRHSALSQFVLARMIVTGTKFGGLPHHAFRSVAPIPELYLQDEHGLNLLSYPENEIATYQHPLSNLAAEAFDSLDEALRRFSEFGRRDRFTPIIVFIPAASALDKHLTLSLYPNTINEIKQRKAQVDWDNLDFEQPYKLVQQSCARHGLVCLNPLDSLTGLTSADFIRPNDDHPSERGHEEMGRLVAAELSKRLRFRESTTRASTTGGWEVLSEANEWRYRPRAEDTAEAVEPKMLTTKVPGTIFQLTTKQFTAGKGFLTSPTFFNTAQFVKVSVTGDCGGCRFSIYSEQKEIRTVFPSKDATAVWVDLVPVMNKPIYLIAHDYEAEPERFMSVEKVEVE